MKQYLISPDQKQYKANLHCHSILSDGKLPPETLKEMYKAHGYDILAITDHERPHCHQQLADPDFMMITDIIAPRYASRETPLAMNMIAAASVEAEITESRVAS